jgi:hypothetical protein
MQLESFRHSYLPLPTEEATPERSGQTHYGDNDNRSGWYLVHGWLILVVGLRLRDLFHARPRTDVPWFRGISYCEVVMRDLKYPEDSRRALDSLCDGLAYDAAMAVAGLALSKTPSPEKNTPDFSVPFRCGGLQHDQAIRRDAPVLLSRCSLISMVSRFEVHAQHLLLQRRVLEYLRGPGKRMDGPNFWRILTQVQAESKSGPLKMCDGLVVTNPSAALKDKLVWLDGLYRVRNCLAHRIGIVQMIDVKPVGLSLDQTKDTDTLKAIWLRPRILVNGKEVQLPHTNTGTPAHATVEFESYVCQWKIGAQIDVNPVDCEAIAMSLSLLARQLHMDFECEMNLLLGI